MTAQPFGLGRAWDLIDALLLLFGVTCPELVDLQPSGDARRVEPSLDTIVLVGSADNPAAVRARLELPHDATQIRHSGDAVSFRYRSTPVQLVVTAPDAFGSALFRTTGSPAHVDAVARRLPGLTMYATEAELYTAAGLAFVPPELRHDSGEIDAAAQRRLPDLIEVADIRGDLHMHTDFSDGRDTLEAMVEACARLRYEYIAITDHSEGASAMRTLSRADVPRQRDAIAAVRDRFPGLTILHGVEVDILAGGELDFPDEILERFDLVLASMHDPASQDPSTLTARCIRAMHQPLVNVVTHPANRLVGRFDGYELDFDAIHAAAVETGTALEVDGAPSHMDLDGAHARAAATAGVTLAVDSDCHRAPLLARQMGFAVGTARRGWVPPDRVLNARPLADLRAFVAAKRRA